MKKRLLTILITLTFAFTCYGQEISFQYDNAGNQTVRQWICINCPPPYTTSNLVNRTDDLRLKNAPTENTSLKRGLVAYPNPTIETLNLSWYSDDQEYIKSIAVFSMAGVRLISMNCSELQKETSISFLQYAAGTYLLKATYSTNREEFIKIINQ